MDKKLFKEEEEPQRVAQGLPQTKEKKQPMIGEKFIKYLEDIGLKHAAYMTEDGNVKVIGLNKDQVKEAIQDIILKAEIKEFMENGLEESDTGERIQKYNDRIKKLRDKITATKSMEQKMKFQNTLKGILQRLSDLKKAHSIKAPHREGFPGGAGVGVSLPGGYINGAPSEDDVNKMKKKLGRDEAITAPDTEPDVITALRDIVKSHQNKPVVDPKSGKKMRVDALSAKAVTMVYDALKNPANRTKFVNSGLPQMVSMAFKLTKFGN